MSAADVDVVIVNYESAACLGACLDSVLGQARVGQVVVVDNNSSDASAEVVAARPSVRWLPTGMNLGFGRGANRGFAAGSAPYVCLLNPDLVVEPGAIARLAEHLDAHADTAIAAPLVRNPDGSVYPSARSFPSPIDGMGHAVVGLFTKNNPWTRRYQRVADPGSPDWVSGTAMLLRRCAIEQVDGFDERYFMYVEDVDLCWRLRQRSWSIAQVPEAVVVHEQGVSARRHPYRSIVDHHRSAWRFVLVSTAGAARALLPLYGAGLAVRLILACVTAALRAGRGPRATRHAPATPRPGA